MLIDFYVCPLAAKHFYHAPSAACYPIRLGKGDRENNDEHSC
jgi:hypothetical protein